MKGPAEFAESVKSLSKRQIYYVDFMMDVLMYTVVLNLFDQYVSEVVIQSFAISLLAAVVMKGLLDVIGVLVQRLKEYFSAREGTGAQVAFWVSAWVILFVSKIAILEIIDLVFEEDVDLGGFLDVLAIVMAMMLARRASTYFFTRLGSDTAGEG